MSENIVFRKKVPLSKPALTIEFYWYITGDGTRKKAIDVTPKHYENRVIEYLGRKDKFDSFLCSNKNEVATLFIGKIY